MVEAVKSALSMLPQQIQSLPAPLLTHAPANPHPIGRHVGHGGGRQVGAFHAAAAVLVATRTLANPRTC